MPNIVMRRDNLEDLPDLSLYPTPRRIIRPLQKESLAEKEALSTLLKAAFPDHEWEIENVEKALVKEPNVGIIFVVEEDDAFLATASVLLEPENHPNTGIVHWVGSHPDYRGQKLGLLVTLATLHEFLRQGLQDAILRTQEFRLPAIRTYQNLGFRPEHINPDDAETWQRVMKNIEESQNKSG